MKSAVVNGSKKYSHLIKNKKLMTGVARKLWCHNKLVFISRALSHGWHCNIINKTTVTLTSLKQITDRLTGVAKQLWRHTKLGLAWYILSQGLIEHYIITVYESLWKIRILFFLIQIALMDTAQNLIISMLDQYLHPKKFWWRLVQ